MSDKKFNFNLGNRSLTAEESTVVEHAKRQFRESFARHHRDHFVAGNAVFEGKSNVAATPSVNRPRGTDVVPGNAVSTPRGTDVSGKGTSSWSTNKVAPANRKY
jgi:hypothetical protein